MESIIKLYELMRTLVAQHWGRIWRLCAWVGCIWSHPAATLCTHRHINQTISTLYYYYLHFLHTLVRGTRYLLKQPHHQPWGILQLGLLNKSAVSSQQWAGSSQQAARRPKTSITTPRPTWIQKKSKTLQRRPVATWMQPRPLRTSLATNLQQPQQK